MVLGLVFSPRREMRIDLTVRVVDPFEVGHPTLYKTVYCGLFSIRVEEYRILANYRIDLLHSR